MLIKTKQKDDCIDMSHHAASVEKSKHQEKHHHKSSNQDKGRLPFLKANLLPHLEAAYQPAQIWLSEALFSPSYLNFPCVTLPCQTAQVSWCGNGLARAKAVISLLIRTVKRGKNAIGKNEGKQRPTEMKHRVTDLQTEHQLCLSAQATLLPSPTFTHLYNPCKIPAEMCGL